MISVFPLPHGTLVYRLRAVGVGFFAFCMLTAAGPVQSMEVTPLVEPAPVADLTPSDPWPRSVGQGDFAFPPPAWTTGKPLPEYEWDHISRRPWAFGPIPMRSPSMTAQAPYGGAASPTLPRVYGPDPAAMPIQPLQTGSGRSRSAKQPAMTSKSTTITGQGVTVPTVAAPTVPGVAAPSVSAPTAPTVSNPAAPNGVKPTAVNPYTATAAPTGPVTPAAPTAPTTPAVNTPATPAIQNPAAVPATASPAPAGPANGTAGNGTAGNGATAGAGTGTAGAGNAGVTGTLQTAPAETPKPRAPVLGGPAESLVIPPAGISLTPNNGSGALTSSPASK